MKISVKASTIVKAMKESHTESVWLSSLDLLLPDSAYHSRSVYFYRNSAAAANFFDAEVLKAALSQNLSEFYPFAGRLRKDDNGRLEINCNNEGALFIEAECDGTIDDFGFTPRPDLSLLPLIDYSPGISTFPLCLVQLTRFKCGGVSLSFSNEHHVADGASALNYINTWSDIAYGRATSAAVPPFLDRRLLTARNPPQPRFPHIESQPPPPLKTPLPESEAAATSSKTFRLTRDQINALKHKCNSNKDDDHTNKLINYTSYEAIAGHVWRCATISRKLPADQETKLQLPVDGRQRLKPPLPRGYFGNVAFYTATIALCGKLESNPLRFAAGKVHEAIAQMDDDYLRSALDYSELRLSNVDSAAARVENRVKCPNLAITSWGRLPFYEADFGWGKPVYAGPGVALFEGKSFLFSDHENEANMMLAITLHKKHMDLFEKILYDI